MTVVEPIADDRPTDLVVIDDDETTLVLVERRLRGSGLRAEYFSDALSGMEFLLSHRTAVLLLDQRMPTLDGISVLERLVEEKAVTETSVFLCSEVPPLGAVGDQVKRLGVTWILKDDIGTKEQLLALVEAATVGWVRDPILLS